MTKFKVGDKIRLVGKEWASYEGYNATPFDATPFDPYAVYTVDKVEEWGVFAGKAGVVYYPKEGRSPLGYEIELVTDADPTSPDHYKFGTGVEVIDISQWLTSNAAQALQYIARSSRIDGKNKGDTVEDLRKAKVFIDFELKRLGAQ